MMPTPVQSSPETLPSRGPTSARGSEKRHRVLACTLCQQRKVKCNRRFPCANCTKTGAQCVPATLAPRQRRRRFSERELLDRLRHYEGLLRQHNIEFEPLHSSPSLKTASRVKAEVSQSDLASPGGASTTKTAGNDTVIKPKNFWTAMNQTSPFPHDQNEDQSSDEDDLESTAQDEVREDAVKQAWDQLPESNDLLLFGSPHTTVNLSTLHPEQVQIFRYWQIYLDNVDPLLKVTHTPTLQARILDAASNVSNISPALEALMFSIYCISIQSLEDDECKSTFGSSKADLLSGYHFGCQQALMNCGVLRTSERDCLTALFLYLISIRPGADPRSATSTPGADPRSLSSMLGVAIRIAQRLGIHYESTYAKYTALEAEMSRRLWWALALFDNRISEMSAYKVTVLMPTWDCKMPTNLNDFDIRLEMKTLPAGHAQPTEAIFAVIRGEVGDVIRKCAFHLDFSNPSLKAIVKSTTSDDSSNNDLTALESKIETQYLQHCNPENPIHFMTIWTTRGYLAKCRLINHYATTSTPLMDQPDNIRDLAVSHALRMLECDTTLLSSPLTKGYKWLIQLHFPFPAYLHIVQDLRKRPTGEHAEKAWRVMTENYDVRFANKRQDGSPLFRVFARTVLNAWRACEEVIAQRVGGGKVEVPRMVADMREKLGMGELGLSENTEGEGVVGMKSDDAGTTMSWDFGRDGVHGMGVPEYPALFSQNVNAMDIDMTQLDWMVDWSPMQVRW